MTREELLPIAKPILFNTEMVQAILEGRKTVTRRIVKLPNYIIQNENGLYTLFADGTCYENQSMEQIKEYIKPSYAAGDYLYVRETWSEWTGGYLYKAWTSPFPQPGKSSIMRWHPSIHMPKDAARLFLKVTDVRVERLQDITDAEAEKEGAKPDNPFNFPPDKWPNKENFKNIWNSTIKKADLGQYGWDVNPWVWVIEFKRVEV